METENIPGDITQAELPPPPEKPDPRSCCQRGCERCIYVYYEEALARWQERVASIRANRGPGI